MSSGPEEQGITVAATTLIWGPKHKKDANKIPLFGMIDRYLFSLMKSYIRFLQTGSECDIFPRAHTK
jgi:hypothetical protein